MIRLLLCLSFWVLYAIPAALVGFGALLITGRIDLLWKISLWGACAGYRLAGIHARSRGSEHLEAGRAYVFMANHVSNLDPPIITAMLNRRICIMAKQELFKIPIFGYAMRTAGFVPVDRNSRKGAIESMRQVVQVLQSGMAMLVFPEGTRSRDSHLLPFKKSLFHLVLEAGVPVVPITIIGSYEAWPKGRLSIHPGEVVVVFHPPIDPQQFAHKEELVEAVRGAIHSALPPQYQDEPMAEVSAG